MNYEASRTLEEEFDLNKVGNDPIVIEDDSEAIGHPNKNISDEHLLELIEDAEEKLLDCLGSVSQILKENDGADESPLSSYVSNINSAKETLLYAIESSAIVIGISSNPISRPPTSAADLYVDNEKLLDLRLEDKYSIKVMEMLSDQLKSMLSPIDE